MLFLSPANYLALGIIAAMLNGLTYFLSEGMVIWKSLFLHTFNNEVMPFKYKWLILLKENFFFRADIYSLLAY